MGNCKALSEALLDMWHWLLWGQRHWLAAPVYGICWLHDVQIPGCLHVPMNIDGKKQTERPTTTEEFFAKLQAAGTRETSTCFNAKAGYSLQSWLRSSRLAEPLAYLFRCNIYRLYTKY